jgi:hypothetical protein
VQVCGGDELMIDEHRDAASFSYLLRCHDGMGEARGGDEKADSSSSLSVSLLKRFLPGASQNLLEQS